MQKKIGILLKMVQYSSICILIYICFIIYKAIYLSSTREKTDGFKLITSDFSTLAGSFNLAFLIQCCITPILKNHQNYKQNIKDIPLGFLVTWVTYNIIGIVGATVIQYSSHRDGTKGATILDFFEEDDYVALVV